ncbi:MAG TPA: 16S rRNA (cytosine(1402)-N(4))-methyltransferase RsmH [Planctomycetota bacterium]|nr:16S rRNA (cytosine(1402)-N(4))-methyltransferase RsmH [Planctomycetota bacterium]
MHQPVLLREVIDLLRPRPGGVYVDGTLGLGGHAEAIAKTGARVLGVEWDDDSAARAAERLGPSVEVVRDSYANLPAILESRNVPVVDGILLDLGVSSPQFDTASRGFSLQRDGPLDMRMSPRIPRTAADLLRTVGERELERILREYGEEPRARKIAAAIVDMRGRRGSDILGSTRVLAEFVERLEGRHTRIHPATRVFQALRIAVNDELENLKKFLETFDRYLGGGGRCCVISFHSLEDRLVKRSFREKAKEGLRLVTKKPVRASRDEVLQNPRARSAKLRCIEKL